MRAVFSEVGRQMSLSRLGRGSFGYGRKLPRYDLTKISWAAQRSCIVEINQRSLSDQILTFEAVLLHLATTFVPPKPRNGTTTLRFHRRERIALEIYQFESNYRYNTYKG